jgi:PPOX class probable F420-dependent enzyme
MSTQVPENFKDLLERPIVVTLVTLMEDLQPQANPVWFSYDGTHILINTESSRAKAKNMRARPKVTVLSVDPENPYRYLEIRGEVVGETLEGGVDHINELSSRYMGKPDFFAGLDENRRKEVRVIFKIKPIKINAH